jgi:tRNA-Thr(GGU) m(6)t(6)A37 methyltransferase TsaA
MQSSNASMTSVVAIIAATASALITASIFARRHQKAMAKIEKLEETRSGERKGRIRAEMKLRSRLKNERAQSSDLDTSNDEGDGKRNGTKLQHNLMLHCIGTVVSPYTKRMGTPRQGALVPSGRGYIQLRIPVECVEGLELYSHAWVLFTFHANTDTPSVLKSNARNDGQFINLTKTKIRPPRGNGIKVGMLATRSPHRPNNIGLSLVKIVKVDKKEKRLLIAAFDLVNGTPVYGERNSEMVFLHDLRQSTLNVLLLLKDIKPVVPWDLPGHHDNVPLSVPTWVSADDALSTVNFTPLSRESIKTHIRNGKLAPLYTTRNDGLEACINSISQILGQDPRATNTNSTNKRGSKEATANSDIYRIVFCSVEILFRVSTNGVLVEDVVELDLQNVLHVDGIPILQDR